MTIVAKTMMTVELLLITYLFPVPNSRRASLIKANVTSKVRDLLRLYWSNEIVCTAVVIAGQLVLCEGLFCWLEMRSAALHCITKANIREASAFYEGGRRTSLLNNVVCMWNDALLLC